MTKNHESYSGASLLEIPNTWKRMAPLLGIPSDGHTIRKLKLKLLQEVIRVRAPKIDDVFEYGIDYAKYGENDIRQFIEDARYLAKDNVVTARAIGEDTDWSTITAHMAKGSDSFKRSFVQGDGEDTHMFNTSGATDTQRSRYIDLETEARQAFIFARPPSKIIRLANFDNVYNSGERKFDNKKTITTKGGGGLRMRLNQVQNVEGRTFVSFDISAVFGDSSVRRAWLDPTTNPYDPRNPYDKDGFDNYPQVAIPIRLEYVKGRLRWPKDDKHIGDYTIEKAEESKDAKLFVRAVLSDLLKRDREAFTVLIRSMIEINPIPNCLSVEVIFYCPDKLTTKIIDVDGVVDNKSHSGDPIYDALRDYALKTMTTVNWPVLKKDTKKWIKKRPKRKKLIENTIGRSLKDNEILRNRFEALDASKIQNDGMKDSIDNIDVTLSILQGINKIMKNQSAEYGSSDPLLLISDSLDRHYSFDKSLGVKSLTQETTMPLYLGRLLKGTTRFDGRKIEWQKIDEGVDVCNIDNNTGLIRINVMGADFVYCIENGQLSMSNLEEKVNLPIGRHQRWFETHPDKLDINHAKQIYCKLYGEYPVTAAINFARHEGD